MKLNTVVYDLPEDMHYNPGLKKYQGRLFKGDNYLFGTGV